MTQQPANRSANLRKRLFGTPWRDVLTAAGPAIALTVVCVAVALYFVDPAPPRSLTMAVGRDDQTYRDIAQRYKDILAEDGITLNIEMTRGAVQDFARLRDRSSNFDVALLQDGLHQSRDPGIQSLGSIDFEPIWWFNRASQATDRLSDLEGRRVSVGEKGSGSELLSRRLFSAGGIDPQRTQVFNLEPTEAADQLIAGKIDAVLMTGAIDSPDVQRLVRAPSVRLASPDQAEALARRFPFLHDLALPQGSLDLRRNLPASDVHLLATTTTVAIRDTLHPALISLLLNAMARVHADAGLLRREHDFPADRDVDFELNPVAARYYKSGPPFLQRYLPFWLASLADRLWVVLVPLLAILIPIGRSVPAIYRWRMKNRILKWYGELKLLEIQLRSASAREHFDEFRRRIDTLEDHVSQIRVPLGFAEEVFVLKEHVELVRRTAERLRENAGQA